jgi:diguanylate cyclase (GGDEF)-like protein
MNTPNRFPLIPLVGWIVLFSLVVVSAGAQVQAALEMRLGIILFWGIALTVLLAVWVHLRARVSEPPVLDAPSAGDLDSATPNLDPVWQASLEREAWFEVLQSVGEEDRLDHFLKMIPAQIQQLLPGTSLGLYVRDSMETLVLRLCVGEHFSGPASLLMSECEAMSRGQLTQYRLLPNSKEYCGCKHHGAGTEMFAICLPIVFGDHFYGLVSLYHPLAEIEGGGSLRSSVLQKAQTLTSALGIFLQQQILRDNLQEQKIRDSLTGLFNRRYMEETLLREFAEAIRRHTSIGVVMVYPDQIATIRNNLGVKASDQLLWEIAQRLPRYIRTEDILCRHDEDHFCVILPGASLEITSQRADKMCRELGGLSILFQEQAITTTFSIGITVFPQHSSTVHGLLAMAEMSVRNSQRLGGNQVSLPPQTTTISWESEP